MVKLGEYGAHWRNHYSLLDNAMAWGQWVVPEPGRKVHRAIGYELVRFLETNKPKVMVEGGCGLSTVLLAGYAARHNAKVTVIEHDLEYLNRVKEALEGFGLEQFVEFKPALLSGGHWYWSTVGEILPDNIDFVLVNQSAADAFGSNGAMARLHSRMSRTGWEIWFSNAQFLEHDRQFLKWSEQFSFSYRMYPLPGGLAIARPGYRPIPMVLGRNLAITIHVNGNPSRMWRMFRSINEWAPGLLHDAHVTVLFTDHDPVTVKELEQVSFINILDVQYPRPMPSGAIYSDLFTKVPFNIPHHLHLENGYSIGTTFSNWLARAEGMLNDPDIGQVRLLHRGASISRYRSVDGKEIRWDREDPEMLVGNADYVNVPTLMRREDLLKLWPADDWGVAAKRVPTHWVTAQSDPGVFH